VLEARVDRRVAERKAPAAHLQSVAARQHLPRDGVGIHDGAFHVEQHDAAVDLLEDGAP
jgi:hypothetical protein